MCPNGGIAQSIPSAKQPCPIGGDGKYCDGEKRNYRPARPFAPPEKPPPRGNERKKRDGEGVHDSRRGKFAAEEKHRRAGRAAAGARDPSKATKRTKYDPRRMRGEDHCADHDKGQRKIAGRIPRRH